MNYYASLYFVIALTMMWQKWLISIPLSNTPIGLFVNGDEESTVLLYNMHDNENTSAMAGRIISNNFGGQYYELVHNGDRNISFTHGEDTLLVDPNRIYTDAGIWQQLAKNENADTVVFEMVATWRDSLLSILKITERSLVIALHNNTNK